MESHSWSSLTLTPTYEIYLRRMALEKKSVTFDQIVLHIMPLLKNGTTPENQTILTVLEDIGIRIGQNSWKLKPQGQGEMEV